ncbi:MAG TPA: hypothetical protein VGO57_03860 [Verrucomicrobiae bacterium]|jgi:hypothetical protein
MANEPAFSYLYRRGKHSPLDGDGNEQKELFAVSAVAFAMKYDTDFKVHFLKQICDVNDVEKAKGYKIHIQPYGCADLALEGESEVIILEFKVGAPLENHQNYSKAEFFKERTGYGYQIEKKYAQSSTKKYVILEQSPNSENRTLLTSNLNIKCSSKVWKNLLDDLLLESPMVKDLLDCLAMTLEINELKGRMFMKKDLAKYATNVFEMKGVLDSLQTDSELDLGTHTADLKISSQAFGVEVRKSVDRFKWLNAYTEDRLIWFGYEPSRISVWICGLNFAGKKDELKKVLDPLMGRFQNTEISEKEDLGSLIIFSSAKRASDQEWQGDQEWFREILKTLKNLSNT